MVDKNSIVYSVATAGAVVVTLLSVFVVGIAIVILMVCAQIQELIRAVAAGAWNPREVINEVLVDGFRSQTSELYNKWHGNFTYVLNKILR